MIQPQLTFSQPASVNPVQLANIVLRHAATGECHSVCLYGIANSRKRKASQVADLRTVLSECVLIGEAAVYPCGSHRADAAKPSRAIPLKDLRRGDPDNKKFCIGAGECGQGLACLDEDAQSHKSVITAARSTRSPRHVPSVLAQPLVSRFECLAETPCDPPPVHSCIVRPRSQDLDQHRPGHRSRSRNTGIVPASHAHPPAAIAEAAMKFPG